MIQLHVASTLYQVASLAAMVDAGTVPVARKRVLVLVNGSQQPELTTPIDQAEGFDALAARFDEVVDFAALLWPRRPHQFSPREEELITWQRLLRAAWGLGEERVELYLDSIQVNPAAALARIFHDADLVIHSDGLMSYGPTRNRLRPSIIQRLRAVAYVELIPGLRPILLSELALPLWPVAPDALRDVVQELARDTEPSVQVAALAASGKRTALLVGQYLVHLGVLTEQEQDAVDLAMLQQAVAHGAQVVAYKPHPSAGPGSTENLLQNAAALGLDLMVITDNVPAEVLMAWLRPAVVVSAFSTALFTARALFGLPAEPAGTRLIAKRLRPFQNSNRIPVVLADAVLGEGKPLLAAAQHHDPRTLQHLVQTVAYAMQPAFYGNRREAAVDFLQQHPRLGQRYIFRRRLAALDLPHEPRTGRPRGAKAVLTHQVLGPQRARSLKRTARRVRRLPRLAAKSLGASLTSWSKRRR